MDWEGEPARLMTTVDITERKRVEQALRSREEQLRLIVDNIPVLIAYVDPEHRYLFANQTLGHDH